MKFKIGDRVIGKPEANNEYSVTQAGYKAIVIDFTTHEVKTQFSTDIRIQSVEDEHEIYDVNSEFFELDPVCNSPLYKVLNS